LTQFEPSGGADSIAGLTAELEQLKATAEQVQESIRSAAATVAAPDGAVTVTVGPSGVLQDLTFGNRAYQRPPEALASLVMQLIGTAQKQVGAQVAGAFSGLVGEDSQAMQILDEFLPRDPEEAADGQATEANEFAQPEEPAPPPPQQQEPPRPTRRPVARPSDNEDDDFSDPW
jgi:DNA-binding protein YbaB